MHVMHPVDIRPGTIDAVNENAGSGSSRDYITGDRTPEPVQLALAQEVRRASATCQMDLHPGIRLQIGIDAKAYQMNVCTGSAKICGQFGIRAIHPARPVEVAGDQNPRRSIAASGLSWRLGTSPIAPGRITPAALRISTRQAHAVLSAESVGGIGALGWAVRLAAADRTFGVAIHPANSIIRAVPGIDVNVPRPVGATMKQ